MLIDDGLWFTTVVDDEDEEIVKEFLHKAVQNYGRYTTEALGQMEFWKKYAGLSVEQSEKLNGMLKWIVEKRYWKYKGYVVRKIARELGIDEKRAELIAVTELANLANYARYLAYQGETNVEKFVWVTEKDGKVCDKCKRMAELTKDGVTLDEMKVLIKEVCGDTAREFICHPRCRCSFIRKYKKVKHMLSFEFP